MATSGTVTAGVLVYDTAGYFGMTSDLPGTGYYRYTATVPGSAGDGVTPGGWAVLAHFAPLAHTTTQTSVGADWLPASGSAVTGGRQAASTVNTSCPFVCDLQNVGTTAWSPAVNAADSATAPTTNLLNATDPSGQTPRMYAVWAGVSSTTSGQASFTLAGTYSWTAPSGVTSVTASPTGAGGGGGAGNASAGGIEYGGGGAGGGEYASGAVPVTPGNDYVVTVGAGGAAGASPGGNGGAGASSVFTGDSASVTAHGGSAGTGATTGGDGAGGAGGTGSSAATHFNGGAGNAGATAADGGGGGSSAGTSVAGNSATDGIGASAPDGGGPGGAGGAVAISVVQTAWGHNHGSDTLTVSFPAAIQAGNAVIVSVLGQSTDSIGTVVLNDGTPLSSVTAADYSGIIYPFTTEIWAAYGASGGQSSVTVTIASVKSVKVLLVQMLEVAGLGPSPSVDTTGSNTANSSSYSVSAVTSAAPELWVAACGASYFSNPSIGSPGDGWDMFTTLYDTQNSSYHMGLRSGYQTVTSPGTEKFAGRLGGTYYHGVVCAAFTASPATPGSVPLTGPGGGGGGGFGAAGDGGAGQAGQVTLTWTGVSGTGYGTPALPAPTAAWSAGMGLDATGAAGYVNINGPAGVTDVVNFLSNPPVFRVAGTAAQSISSTIPTTVTFSGATPTVDSYAGWSPNLVQNPGFETGSVSPWTGGNGATIAIETSHVRTGTYAASVTPDGVTSYPAIASGFLPVTAGQFYTISIWALASAGLAHTVAATISWYDSGHSYLSSTNGTATSLSTSVWTSLAVTGTAPAGAVYGVCAAVSQAAPGTSAEVFYADDGSFSDSGSYVVPRDGLYLFHGVASFSTSAAGTRLAGATINGTTYWGPGCQGASSTPTGASKTQILSLRTGDTVKLSCRQDSGGALALSSTTASRMFLVWLCAPGTPAQQWAVPDTTFRWASGTSGDALPALFQEHLANDLGFLVNRPLLMAYQATAQTGLTVGSFSTVTLDTVGGIVHSDAGDTYSGWTAGASNLYTAPVDGWFLVAGEFFTSAGAGAGETVTAGLLPSTSGGVTPHTTPDYYQALAATSTAAVGGGATVLAVQYCLAGETITPQVMGTSFAAPYATLAGASAGGVFASHLEAVWISS